MPYIKVLPIKANADGTPFVTYLKTHPIDRSSTKLPPDFAAYKTGPKAPPLAAVKVIRDVAQHARIEFDPHLTIAGKRYKHLYIFAPHWDGVTALIKGQVATASPLSPAGSSIVERQNTHYAQANNYDWADDGSQSNLRYGGVQCGLASCAIVMSEPGFLTVTQIAEIMAASPTGKFDDGVAAIFKKLGAKSTVMEGHAAVFRYFGIDTTCTRSATTAELKQHIEQHSAAVIGTLYGGVGLDATPDGAGHFVGATGFDIKKNLVKILDPNGIRDKQSTNRWVTRFTSEADVRPDWWEADTMAELWAKTQDGWCVLPKPKGKPTVLQAAATQAIGGIMSLAEAMAMPIPYGCSRVIPLRVTPFKARPVMSAELKPEEKDSFDMNEAIIGVVSIGPAGHILVTLPGAEKIKGRNTWYLYKEHVTIETPGGVSLTTPGAKITEGDITAAAALISVEARALKAVMMVEAAGGGFLPSGRPKILFEALYFSDFTGGRYDRSHPNISTPKWDPDTYFGGEAEWDRMEAAMRLDRSFALQSASYGLGQIMGSHSQEMPSLGYVGQVERWLTDNQHSEGRQLRIMAQFIADNPAMLTALQNKSWARFAKLYNGESYAANRYDVKLAEAYAKL